MGENSFSIGANQLIVFSHSNRWRFWQFPVNDFLRGIRQNEKWHLLKAFYVVIKTANFFIHQSTSSFDILMKRSNY